MDNFIKIFNFLTNTKLKNIDEIFEKYNNKKLGEILNIYLTINGFRKSCLTDFKFSNIDIKKFENTFNIKIYKIESKMKKIKIFLITTLKTNNIKKLSEDYEKHILNKDDDCDEECNIVHEKMGKALDYINPSVNNSNNGIIFKIYYKDKFITSQIYLQTINNNLNNKNLQKINKKMLLMNNLLTKISNNINLKVEIDLNKS
jgi:hypothetical protein